MCQTRNTIETSAEIAEYLRQIAFRIQTTGQLQPHLDDLADAMLDWYAENAYPPPGAIDTWPAPPPAASLASSASSPGAT